MVSAGEVAVSVLVVVVVSVLVVVVSVVVVVSAVAVVSALVVGSVVVGGESASAAAAAPLTKRTIVASVAISFRRVTGWIIGASRICFEDQIAEGDKVVTRIRVTGTHAEDLRGIPKNREQAGDDGGGYARIEDGKLAEKWSNKDERGFLQQLGVIPTPENAHAS